jgi:hypothetical protein
MLSLSAMIAYRWCLFTADEVRRIAANVAHIVVKLLQKPNAK